MKTKSQRDRRGTGLDLPANTKLANAFGMQMAVRQDLELSAEQAADDVDFDPGLVFQSRAEPHATRKHGRADAPQNVVLRDSAIWLLYALAALLAPVAFGQFQYQQLKSFGFPEQSAGSPNGLIQGSDGALYGTAGYGGSNLAGVVFKLDKDGRSYTVLHHFAGTFGDGN